MLKQLLDCTPTVVELIDEKPKEREEEPEDFDLQVCAWFREPFSQTEREQTKTNQIHQYAAECGRQEFQRWNHKI